MILPAHDITITDGDRFRALFTDPEKNGERLEIIADTLGIDPDETPPAQILDCMRVICDVLVKEQRVPS